MNIRKLSSMAQIHLPNLSLRKIINFSRYAVDFKKRKPKTSSFPPFIAVQPSAYCCANCQLCPVGLGLRGPDKGFMDVNLYKRIVDETDDVLMKIYFGDWGEPFMHPDIYKLIAYAHERHVATSASTNFHLFQKESDIEQLARNGVSAELLISLHAASQKTYEAYQPGRSFERVVDAISQFISIRKRLMISRPFIRGVFAITKKNQHEIEAMRMLCGRLGIDCLMYPASINARFYLRDIAALRRLVEEWAPDNFATEINSDNNSIKESMGRFYTYLRNNDSLSFGELEAAGLTGRHCCSDPWTSLVIGWDGRVSLCCADFNRVTVGNAADTPLREIWNNEAYANARKYITSGRSEYARGHPCACCIPN